MRIFVLSNCHYPGITGALQALLPSAEITGFRLGHAPAETMLEDAAAAAARCDHIVTMPVKRAEYGPLRTELLRPRVPALHVLPPVVFPGFHPDEIEVLHANGVPVRGLSMGSHSRIALLGYLAGLDVADTVGLYNRLNFRRLGYLASFAWEVEQFTARFAGFGLDAEPLVQSWLAQGCFMYSPLHPMPRALLDMARIACGMVGAAAADGVTEAQVPDHLATYPRQPVHPEIAEAAGVAPIDGFWTEAEQATQKPARKLNTAEFVAGSFEAFAGVPGKQLITTSGVPAGLAALRLKSRF